MNNEFSSRKLMVGASDLCDIVMLEDTVSREHCELEWREDHWWVRDLGSTNGTFINGRRISGVCKLIAGDKLSLGRGVQVTLPESLKPPIKSAARDRLSNSASDNVHPVSHESMAWPKWVPAIAGAGALIIVSFIAMMAIRTSTSSEVLPVVAFGSETDQSDRVDQVIAPKAEDCQAYSQPNSQVVHSGELTSNAAVWALVVETESGVRHLLGTAIAISKDEVLTLASVATVAEKLKDYYPKLLIVSNGKQGLAVEFLRVHPEYATAEKDLLKFRRDLEFKLEGIAKEQNPTLEESLNWSDRLNAITSKLNSHDLALLKAKGELTEYLQISQSMAFSTGCELQGYPAIADVPVVVDRIEPFQLQLRARLSSVHGEIAADMPTVEFESETSVPPISLACIDTAGKLFGLCGSSSFDRERGAQRSANLIRAERF